MAFDFTNNLETAVQANADFDFTDRAGNTLDTVKSANTAGEWCEENGSTTSSGTGPGSNPTGRAGFVYTETSSPSASTTWAMKRDTSRNAATQACTYKLIYNRNFESASEFYFEYATVASPNETTDWTIFATVVGNLTDAWIQGTWDLSAQTTTTLWTRIRFNSTSDFTNDAAFSTWNEVGVDRAGIASVTSSDPDYAVGELDFGDTDVDAAGTSFGATIGSSDVYLSPNDLLSEAGEVDITAAVNTWADTNINLDFSLLSQATIDSLHTMGPGARFLIVNVGGVPGTTEYFAAITLHRPAAFEMVAGALTPGTTTARLTGMTGTFGGGRAEEAAAQNPSTTTTDVAEDGNREDLWLQQAKTGAREVSYDFRVLYDETVPDTITQTPQVTISAGPSPLAADSGSYTWTGTAASLEYGSLVTAAAGSYAWTGTAASLEFGALVTAEAGSYSWAGQDASFLLDTSISAEAGSYSWTGTAASLELGALVSAEAGSYAWTGQDASLEFGAAVTAEAGSYSWAGQAASLELGSLVSAESGAYSWTGTAASLEFGSLISAESGSYVWTGSDATFPAGLTLSAESGSYSWTGSTVGLVRDSILTAEAASYAWAGQDATFVSGFLVTAESGAYSWTGTPATLVLESLISAEAGIYLWTGQDATFPAGLTISAEPGAYDWTGADAALTFAGGALAAQFRSTNRMVSCRVFGRVN